MRRRHAGVEENLTQQRCTHRRRLRRLQDDGVPRSQRGRGFVRDHVERRIERGDAAHDAARNAYRERHPMRMARRAFDRNALAGKTFSLFSRHDERLHRAAHLVVRIGGRESRFGDNRTREQFTARFDQFRGFHQHSIARLRIQANRLERATSRSDGRVDLRARRTIGDADQFSVEFVEHFDRVNAAAEL